MADNDHTHKPPPADVRSGTSTNTNSPSADQGTNGTSRGKAPSPWKEVPNWICQRPWPVMLFSGLFVLAIMAWTADSCVEECLRSQWSRFVDYALPVVTLTWIALLFAWFIDCFTGDPFEKRTKGIEFAYFFMVLSFCLVAIMIADIGKARKFGVVEGCVENLSRGNVMPIQCDYPRDMWSAPKAAPDDKKEEKKDEKKADDSAPKLPDFNTRTANYRENHNFHFVLNIGGRLDRLEPPLPAAAEPAACKDCPQAIYSVRGGLPVPVYFIVLALIGGAISLAKNVPGIQKRSDLGWTDTPTDPRLTPGEVRELLIYQVLQFVTAPMLAVIAYHTIKPESSGSTVALGFVVGFGSDQILQLIRGMVKGPQGTAPASPLSMSIQGKVVRGHVPVSGAKVTVEGITRDASTDAKGEFALAGLPVRTDAYVVKVASGDQTQVRRVKADEPKVVDLGAIDMTPPPAPPAHAA